jgi:hypothetical protein
MAVALRSMSPEVVAQLLMLMRIARRPRHAVGPHQQDPRPVFAGPLDQRNERIACPAVNVASLQADDRGAVQAGKAGRDDTSLVVDWQPQRAITAEAD